MRVLYCSLVIISWELTNGFDYARTRRLQQVMYRAIWIIIPKVDLRLTFGTTSTLFSAQTPCLYYTQSQPPWRYASGRHSAFHTNPLRMPDMGVFIHLFCSLYQELQIQNQRSLQKSRSTSGATVVLCYRPMTRGLISSISLTESRVWYFQFSSSSSRAYLELSSTNCGAKLVSHNALDTNFTWPRDRRKVSL
jgi:hypothetical protein